MDSVKFYLVSTSIITSQI